MIRSKLLPIVLLVASQGIPPASAEPDPTEICKSLLNRGIYDKYGVFSQEKSFNEIKRVLATSSYSTYENAEYSQTNFGLSVPDILSAAYGGTTNSSNYQTRRAQLLATDFSRFSSDSNFTAYMEVASKQLADAFVQCVDKTANVKGFTAWVTPSKTLQSFTVTARHITDGVPNFTISRLDIKPALGVTCDIKLPFTVKQATTIVSCSKPAQATVQVSMVTTAGLLPAQDIEGLDDVLGAIRAEVTAIRASGGLTPKGAIAFFELSACPPGWKPFERGRGRYIVGILDGGKLGAEVGSSLADEENRSTGKHSHKYRENGFGFGGGTPQTCQCGGGPGETAATYDTQSSGLIDGTNAPYIQLLACQRQ